MQNNNSETCYKAKVDHLSHLYIKKKSNPAQIFGLQLTAIGVVVGVPIKLSMLSYLRKKVNEAFNYMIVTFK